MGNTFEMSETEKYTALREIPLLFPVLLFPNKHNKKRSAVEKDTIMAQPTPKVSGLGEMEGDYRVCRTDNNKEILDNADGSLHDSAIGRKTLGQKQHFTTYKSTHIVEEQNNCSVSGKKSSKNSVAIEHKRVDDGEKPYECSERGKRLRDQSTLIRYKRIHSGEKPYECSECEEKFSQHNDLIK